MNQLFQGVEISAISACVPKNIISNIHFEEMLSPKELRIFEKTVGIVERRWANPTITASDLGYNAAENLFESQGINRQEINSLIFISQTPDYKIPFTSNILQDRLGLRKDILCLDMNAGCAGFIQGLATAFSLASSVGNSKVLLIMAETMSKILSEKDRGTTMLFGDGAAAVLIENTGMQEKQAFFNFFSDGAHADAIMIPDGGYRNIIKESSLVNHIDESGNIKNALNLSMDGPRVFDFTLREVAPSIQQLLQYSGLDVSSIDYFLMHQSNDFIIKQIASKLNVPSNKVLVNINKYGNTSGVSIPLLMAESKEKLQHTSHILLSGYGVGLNWGNCILKNMDIAITDLIEI